MGNGPAPEPTPQERINQDYDKKPSTGSSGSSNLMKAINGAVGQIAGLWAKATPLAMVLAFVTTMNDSGGIDVDTLKKCLQTANMNQTVLEQIGKVHALESCMKNENEEESFHDKLKSYSKDIQEAVHILYGVAEEQTNIVTVQSFVYSAGIYLILCAELKYKAATMNKTAADFVDKGTTLKKQLINAISGKRESVLQGGGGGHRIQSQYISCTVKDTNHGIEVTFAEINKEPPSVNQIKQIANNYVMDKSQLNTALEEWATIMYI